MSASPASIRPLPVRGPGGYPATDFTAVAIRTTGVRPGHVVELAAVRIRPDGTVAGEFGSLVDPGTGPGMTAVHGITGTDLEGAPPFPAILGPLLELCRGSVVATHDLPALSAFLTAEVARAGLALPPLPAISTSETARAAVPLPNYRLATVVRAFGLGTAPGQSALAGARATARVVRTLFAGHGFTFGAPPAFPPLPVLTVLPMTAPPKPRIPADAGEPSWMAEVVERVPAVAGHGYLDLLADVVADHHLSADEVRALAALAAESGLTEAEVHGIHYRFVVALRAVAEGDGVVTADEEHDLRQVASALEVPEVVSDLRVTASASRPTRVLVLGGSADADVLRARVLADGFQLARKLTATVTHLVHDTTVPAGEPRLARARELGAAVFDLDSAPAQFTRPVAPEPRTVVTAPVPPPRRPSATPPDLPLAMVVGGWVLTGVGLLLMLITVIGMFVGLALGGGVFIAILGLGALVGGWWIAEEGRLRRHA